MSKQYCFNIENPRNVEYDVDELKKFVQKLYTDVEPEHFQGDSVPFVTIYSRSDNNVCIQMTSRGKKNIELVEKINDTLKTKTLLWKHGIKLGKPYEFNVDVVTWWDNKEKPTQKGGVRWKTLSHRGPYFTYLMEPMKILGVSLIYDGRKYPLSPQEEKVAVYYGKRLISEQAGNVVENLTKDEVFNRNFWHDFQKYLSPDHKKIFRDFSKIVWSDVVSRIESTKQKELTKAEKA